ncbi:unnamed protein product [Clonostachys rhizophaga]|uniref:Uncharacterized protein n=1 Tax=Clonostachys rhizophaga TaxID=160324 RepID=A0A9N9VM08_9HYPO|nr:unnamed protein product [Clonostachys rhizophaga]
MEVPSNMDGLLDAMSSTDGLLDAMSNTDGLLDAMPSTEDWFCVMIDLIPIVAPMLHLQVLSPNGIPAAPSHLSEDERAWYYRIKSDQVSGYVLAIPL